MAYGKVADVQIVLGVGNECRVDNPFRIVHVNDRWLNVD